MSIQIPTTKKDNGAVIFGNTKKVSKIAINMGLSHSDAEVVICFSSAYKGTPERHSAAKKHI